MKQRIWLRYLLMIGWMAVIFWASATPNLKAVPLAQRFGFLPDVLGPAATGLLELALRKSTHMIAFGTLALLARHALAGSFARVPARRHGYMAFYLAVLYAISDEWHQSFVPTRDGTSVDVFIDAAGAALALLLVRQRRNGYTGDRESLARSR